MRHRIKHHWLASTTKIVGVLLIAAFSIFVYFRWFSYSYGVAGTDIVLNLPDVIDPDYLLGLGYEHDGDCGNGYGFTKKDAFQLHIGGRTFSDSFQVTVGTSWDSVPLSPYYLLHFSDDADERFMRFLSKPDSVIYDTVGCVYAMTTFYTLDGRHRMTRNHWRYFGCGHPEYIDTFYVIRTREFPFSYKESVISLAFWLTGDSKRKGF